MFKQILDPTGNLFITWLVALVPVAALLFMLAALRWSAWIATLIGSLITLALALWVWHMPLDDGIRAYVYGAATGVWNVNWITFWGVMLFNTLVITGTFDKLRRWLIAHANHLSAHAGRIAERAEDVEDGREAETASNRHHVAHGRVIFGRMHVAESGPCDRFGNAFRRRDD